MIALLSKDVPDNVSEAMADTAEQISEEVDKVSGLPGKAWEWILSQIPVAVHGLILIIAAIIIFFVGRKVIKWLCKLFDKSFKRSAMDDGVCKFLLSFIKVVLNVLLVVMIAGFIGIETTSLAAIVGSAGLAIGLSLQGSLANFAGGVLILIIKPFVLGDYISSNGQEGTVVHIDIFYTRLLTIDNRMIVIPNGTLSNAVITNVSNENERRVDLIIGVAYGEDIDKVKKILKSVADSHADILHDKPVDIYVDALDSSSVNIGFRVWTSTPNYWKVRWDMLENTKKEFDKNDITIPFNQLDVNVKS